MLTLQIWGQIKSACIDWFSDPHRVLVPLSAIAVVLFLTMHPRKRSILAIVVGLALSYSLLISPVGAKLSVKGLTLPIPPDTGQPADAIVILGRGRLAFKARTETAAKLWQSRRAPYILSTGWGEAIPLNKRLIQLGVPPEVILTESKARTTEENARLSAPILRQYSIKRIILMTDQPHMLRSLLTFRSFGFEVIPYPVSVPSSLPSIEVTTLALREYIGLLSYATLGRFSPRSTLTATSERSRDRLSALNF